MPQGRGRRLAGAPKSVFMKLIEDIFRVAPVGSVSPLGKHLHTGKELPGNFGSFFGEQRTPGICHPGRKKKMVFK